MALTKRKTKADPTQVYICFNPFVADGQDGQPIAMQRGERRKGSDPAVARFGAKWAECWVPDGEPLPHPSSATQLSDEQVADVGPQLAPW